MEMAELLDFLIFFQVFLITSNNFLHHIRSRCTEGDTLLHTGFHADSLINILLKDRTDFLIFLK